MTPDERVSAYLDDELSEAETERFIDDVAADPALATELEDIGLIRRHLRELDAVDPPFGFYERMLVRAGRRQRRSRAVAAVAAVAAVFLVFASFTPVSDSLEVVPAFDSLVAEHAAASPDMDRSSELAVPEVRAMTAMTDGPDAGARSMEMRHAVSLDDSGVSWVQYEDTEGKMLSIFRQPGRLDTDGLPDDAAPMSVGENEAWMAERGGREVMVVDKNGMVFTIIADDDHSTMMDMAAGIPDHSQSLVDRARGAAMSVLERFSFA